MKTIRYSSKWKTDPRTAYLPGVVLGSFVIVLCLIAGPAWSFEVVHDDVMEFRSENASSSPSVADTCLPLLKSIRQSPQIAAVDRNHRTAGKAAALGLVLGARFALSPPNKAGLRPQQPRLDIWQSPVVNSNDRSALAVMAYRQCQKEQALQALGDFRWSR